MKKELFLILAILILCFTACNPRYENNENLNSNENITANPTSTQDLSDIIPKLSEGVLESQMKASVKYLEYFSVEDENLVFSPLSINTALSMLYLGSASDTKKELEKILYYKEIDIKEVLEGYNALSTIYLNIDDVSLSNANSIWIDDVIEIKRTYLDLIENNFGAEIELIDLQSKDSTKIINEWVNNATNSMISEIIDESVKSSNAKLFLLNAIYFNGFWTDPFDSMYTQRMEFHGTNSSTYVDMMYTQMDVLGYKHDNCKTIMLPYGESERFCMIAVIPEEDIEQFIASQSYESIQSILSDFINYENINIYLPKFEVESTIDLKSVFGNIAEYKGVFSNANLSLITDSDFDINVAIHKAKIDVNEEGTEAAAVTLIGANTSEKDVEYEFVANKPFIYFIVDTEYNLILFAGKIANLS